MENEFISVAVHNNRDGEDAAILARFGEPAWNNPVLRFLDGKGQDIVPRRDRVWSSGKVASRLVEVLLAAGRDVPPYLLLAERELSPERTATATFAMHCFWEGEVRLGGLDGVLFTRAGWVDSHEVVEVVFDTARIRYGDLLAKALGLECASKVFVHDKSQEEAVSSIAPERSTPIVSPARDAKRSDDKYRLKETSLRFLPLTPMQATKINAALGKKEDPLPWLSPGQRSLAKKIAAAIKNKPEALDHLVPPHSVDGLVAYEKELLAVLAAALEK